MMMNDDDTEDDADDDDEMMGVMDRSCNVENVQLTDRAIQVVLFRKLAPHHPLGPSVGS
jgi:hypothetical protein